MSQRRGWENVCCVENGNLANLIDFCGYANQMPNSAIESAESLCLSVQSDHYSSDKSRPCKESGLAR
jgi:hypothetical protein